jgi:hypothetical protein
MFQRNGRTRDEQLATVEAAREVVEHARTLVQLEVELALREVRGKATTAAVGGGFGAAGALFAVLMTGFAFAAIAAALATTLAVWLSILIVTVLLALLSRIAALVAVRLLKRAAPPVPGRAILEAKRTRDAVARL